MLGALMDPSHCRTNSARAFRDTGHQITHRSQLFKTGVHGDDRFRGFLLQTFYEIPYGIGALSGFPGQPTNLICNHRKAATSITGARRFDRGIQRQQIGLIGNIINGFGNPAYVKRCLLKLLQFFCSLLRLAAQAFNTVHAALGCRQIVFNLPVYLTNEVMGIPNRTRYLPGRRLHLSHRSSNRTKLVGLGSNPFVKIPGKSGVTRCDHGYVRSSLLQASKNRCHGFGQPVNGTLQVDKLATRRKLERSRIVTPGHCSQMFLSRL